MKNILVIGNLEGDGGLKNRMDKNLYNFYAYLKQHSKYSIELYNSDQKTKLIEQNNENNIILVLPGCKLEYINDLKGIKIYEMMDVTCRCGIYKCLGEGTCRSNELVNYLKTYPYDYLFYHYDTYIFREKYGFMKNQFYYPHFINHEINKNYELEKKYDILFYGSDWIKVYPLRSKLKKLLKSSPFQTRIVDYENPVTGEELSKLINQSWITICTKSNHNLLLQKYMEVAMNHSVICGDFPDLEEKVFGDNMIYIDISMSSRQITTVLSNYLNNKELLQKMSNQTYNIACERYTYEKGCSTFDNYIDQIVQKNDT
jgi:hypothetical protein